MWFSSYQPFLGRAHSCKRRPLVYDHFFKFSEVASTRALTVLESPLTLNSGEQVNLHASTNQNRIENFVIKCQSHIGTFHCTFSMEGMILTGPHLLNCDSYSSQISHFPKALACSHLRFREALVGKMLIPKPFTVVKILDSYRVLLDIIKSCLPWERGWGCGLGKNPY